MRNVGPFGSIDAVDKRVKQAQHQKFAHYIQARDNAPMSPLAAVEILPSVVIKSAESDLSKVQNGTPESTKVPRNMVILRDKLASREVLDNYSSLLELRERNIRQR